MALPGPAAPPDLAALFTEPPQRSSQWYRATYARLLAAGAGLVLAADAPPAAPGAAPAVLGVLPAPRSADGADAPYALRAASAGVPAVAPGGDVAAARRATYPGHAALAAVRWGVGCPAPALVLVADVDPRASPWPLYARSGLWLFRALRELGHDELRCLVGNAHEGATPIPAVLRAVADATAAHAPTVVALGEAAAVVLREADVDHVVAPHPAWARRFAYKEGPAGFAARLHAAGVPAGPWRSVVEPARPPLPVAPCEGAPPPWVADTGLPDGVGYRPRGRHGTRKRGDGLARVHLERARRLFVTGQVDTVKDAAAKAGISDDGYAALLRVYRSEAWEEERAAQVDRVREQFYREAADAEVKALAASRRVASSALLDALTRVQERLREGDPDGKGGRKPYAVKASDAKALAETVALLDDRGGGAGGDARLQELRALPPVEQAKRLVATLRDQFGEDVVKAEKPAAGAPGG